MSEQKKQTIASRRDFLKVAGIGTVGMAAAGNIGIARGANAGGTDLIKVALIGCGGRGVGSLQDRFAANDNVKVVALADVVEEPMENAVKLLGTSDEHKDKLDVGDRMFAGFDGYKHAIECCDLALVVSPPAFHPIHYAYAVEKGKHVFIEKPFGVDARGYKICMEANKMADDKGLTVCGGFQRRYENQYREWVSRIHDGEIGDLLATRVYWNGGGAKVRGVRGDGEPEIRFQARDWYFFNWLSGDHIVEQHCHNIDVGNWIHGKGDPLAHPVSCVGMGGRQVRRTPGFPYNECGNIFDHHYVEYTYADGSIMHSQCRQIPGCWNSVTEKVLGSNGTGQIAWLQTKNGPRWQYRASGDRSGFVQEHIDQADAMRNGKKMNDGWHSATATMIAVMGWMATYSGREIKWDEAVEKGRALFPYDVELTFDTPSPVMPGPDGTYEHAVPVPGKYEPFV
ncbi:MAG: Gfo/Idh/MocA family oxidoreductase [Planctomycetaceae bacterium]|nr:Gfo/Idh/MocA family oxidoreductase [Planctomycetaceae bacterium]